MTSPRAQAIDPRPSLRPTQVIQGASRYQVPRHPAPVELKLDSNEGAAPQRASALEEALSSSALNRYPSRAALTEAMAGQLEAAHFRGSAAHHLGLQRIASTSDPVAAAAVERSTEGSAATDPAVRSASTHSAR